MTGLLVNPFTFGNPFLGTKLLGFSVGRGSGALKGVTQFRLMCKSFFFVILVECVGQSVWICSHVSIFFFPLLQTNFWGRP